MSTFEYTPENRLGGEFPVVTEVATAGAAVKKMMPVVISNGKIINVTADTVDNIVGLAVEDAAANKETLYYATGEFQTAAVALPTDVTVDTIKPILAKINIYLR